MPIQFVKTLYHFDELSDRAKETAREWYRSGYACESWWEFTYDDAEECARLMGIELKQRPVPLVSGKTRYDPAIYFSGFYCQGDGACFDASYHYAKGGLKAIRKHAPKDTELHRIAAGLQAIQRRHFYLLEASSRHSGRYSHSGCMSVDVFKDGYDAPADVAQQVTRLLRDFADWIYRQLRDEYEYLMSDESVDESIRANDYTFDKSGEREDAAVAA